MKEKLLPAKNQESVKIERRGKCGSSFWAKNPKHFCRAAAAVQWKLTNSCALLNQSTLSSIAQLETTICPLKVLLICHEKFKSLSKVSKSLFWEWTQQQHCDDDKSHKIWKVHPFTPHLHPGFNEIHFRTSCTHYAPFLTWPVDPIHLLISTSKNSFWSASNISVHFAHLVFYVSPSLN